MDKDPFFKDFASQEASDEAGRLIETLDARQHGIFGIMLVAFNLIQESKDATHPKLCEKYMTMASTLRKALVALDIDVAELKRLYDVFHLVMMLRDDDGLIPSE